MVKFDVCIKSGTCGWNDYDDCDMVVQENIETEQLPNKYDYISLYTKENCYVEYFVTEVHRSFSEGNEFNTVYVSKV